MGRAKKDQVRDQVRDQERDERRDQNTDQKTHQQTDQKTHQQTDQKTDQRDQKQETKKLKDQVANSSPSSGSCGLRMKAAVICFVIGVSSSVAGTVTLNIPGVGLGVFALLFSAGNLCSLLSVTFLIGPKNQILTMCAKERAIATFLLLFFLGLTLMSAIQWDNSVASLVFCILQFLAFLWYLLSYVPYARIGVSRACSAICC